MEEEKKIQVSLTMAERLVIVGTLLPSENDIVYIRTSKRLKEDLLPSEEEEVEYEFTRTEVKGEPRLLWKKEKEKDERAFPFTPRAFKMIQDNLKTMNENKKITDDHVSLWDKFDMDKE